MKLLVVGDIHIRRGFLADGLKLVNAIVEQTASVKPDGVVFMGDLLDTHGTVSVSCFTLVSKMLLEIAKSCRVYVIVGNHDISNPGIPLRSESIFDIFHRLPAENLTIVREPKIFSLFEDVKILLVPFLVTGTFSKTLESYFGPEIYSSVKMIFCHQEFEGSLFEDSGDKWDESKPIVFSGHIHREIALPSGVFYVGAPIETGHVWQIRITEDGIVRRKRLKLENYEAKSKIEKKIEEREIKFRKTDENLKTILETLKEKIKGTPLEEVNKLIE